MVKNSVLATCATIAGVALSVLLQWLVARHLGAGFETDVYLISTTLPLLVSNLVSAVASTALVPIYIEERTRRGDDAAWAVASGFTCWSVLLAVVPALLMACSPQSVMAVLAPCGSEQVAGLGEVALRYAAPSLPLLVAGGIFAAILNARGRFLWAASAQCLLQSVPVGALIFLGGDCGAVGLAVSLSLGAIFQSMVLMLCLARLPFGLRIRREVLFELGKMILPLVLGGAAYQFLPALERRLASELSEGAIAHLGNASRLGMIVAPLLVSGLASVLLTMLSDMISRGDRKAAADLFNRVLNAFFYIGVPAVVFAGFFGRWLVEILLVHGRFTKADGDAVSVLLPWYLAAGGFSALGTLIGRAYFTVLRDSLTPSLVVVPAVLAYFVCGGYVVARMGVTGIAALTCVFWVLTIGTSCALLFGRWREWRGRSVAVQVVRCLLCALISGGAVYFVYGAMGRGLVAGGLLITLGCFMYVILTVLTGASEPMMALNKLCGRFGLTPQTFRGRY